MLKAIVFLVAAAVAGSAFGQRTYRYVDPSGHTVFSDQPPPTGTPYTVHGTALPSSVPQTGVPATPPLPTVQQPSTPALPNVQQPGTGPGTIPQSAVPVDPSAARDRRALEARDELQTDRRDMQLNVPIGEGARDVRDVQRNVPAGEAARERRDMQLNVPAGEAAREARDVRIDAPSGEAGRERRDMQRNVPADEQAREREAVKLNQ